MSVEREHVAELRRFSSQHVDIRARREKLLARPADDHHVHTGIESRLNDGLIEFLETRQCVRICRRIIEFDHGNAAVRSILDQCHSFGSLSQPRRGERMLTPLRGSPYRRRAITTDFVSM